MKTFLRSTLLAFVIIIFSIGLQAQSNYKIKNIGGTEYLLPTVELLASYLDQDFQSWKSTMQTNGFSLMDDKENVAIYMKGEQLQQCLAISKNIGQSGLISFEWFNFKSDESLLNDFFEFIKPYYLETANDIYYHKYRNWLIGTKKDTGDDYLIEHIWITKAL